MLKNINQTVDSGDGSINALAGRDQYLTVKQSLSPALADEKIENELENLQRA